MVSFGNLTFSDKAGQNHTFDEFKSLYGHHPKLRGVDLEKLYKELGGDLPVRKKQAKGKEKD